MVFGAGTADLIKPCDIRVMEHSVKGRASQVKGKGQKVKYYSLLSHNSPFVSC